MKTKNLLLKRMLIALTLGAAAGFLCAYGAAQAGVADALNFSSPMFWTTFINRLTLGFVVGLAGFVMVHPLFGLRCYWWLRGPLMGIFVSLQLAIGTLFTVPLSSADSPFWLILIAGGVFGLLIDGCGTRFAGEGKDLMS